MDNPYGNLLHSCTDVHEVQERYEVHRQFRNTQQREKLSSPMFKALEPDQILVALLKQSAESPFTDPRHNLVFWARPGRNVCNLIDEIQQKLLIEAPNLWLMPLDCLHMTVLEILHSTTGPVIEGLLKTLQPRLQGIVDFPSQHPVRLIKPMLGFDASALALTFVPAASEGATSESADNRADRNIDAYSYHHLRRDIYDLSKNAGLEIISRYTVLSAHLTVARFTSETGFSKETEGNPAVEPSQMKNWLSSIDSINEWLRDMYWPKENGDIKPGGEWIVGQEKGFECRTGTCWYGGGETVVFGKAS